MSRPILGARHLAALAAFVALSLPGLAAAQPLGEDPKTQHQLDLERALASLDVVIARTSDPKAVEKLRVVRRELETDAPLSAISTDRGVYEALSDAFRQLVFPLADTVAERHAQFLRLQDISWLIARRDAAWSVALVEACRGDRGWLESVATYVWPSTEDRARDAIESVVQRWALEVVNERDRADELHSPMDDLAGLYDASTRSPRAMDTDPYVLRVCIFELEQAIALLEREKAPEAGALAALRDEWVAHLAELGATPIVPESTPARSKGLVQKLS